MNRIEWLRVEGSTAMVAARHAASLVKAVNAECRRADRSITALTDMVTTACREPVLAVPHDIERFKTACRVHGLTYTMTGIQVNLVRIDLTACSRKVRNHIMKYIKELVIQVTIRSDNDVKYGSTARLTPTVQKIK